MSVEIEDKLKVMGDDISKLTLTEAVALSDYLEEEHGIKPAAGGGVMMAGPVAGEEIVEEQTSFDVILTSFDTGAKIKVIKAVRAETGLGLKEAKTLTESVPVPIKEGISKVDAETLSELFKGLGAEVEIK